MAQNKSEMYGIKQHHFLFHIFKIDKAENPMPQNRVNALLYYLISVFTDNEKDDKGRE